MRIFISTLVIFCFFQSALAEPSNLRKEFIDYTESLMQASIEFSCANDTFKLEKRPFSSDEIYWKSGLDWVRLNDLDVKSTGVSFEGLISTGGVPKDKLNVNLNLPFFNYDYHYMKPMDYFSLLRNENTFPIKITVDFYSSTSTTTNLKSITDYLTFDSEAYTKIQTKIERDADFDAIFKKSSKVANARLKVSMAKVGLDYLYGTKKHERLKEIEKAEIELKLAIEADEKDTLQIKGREQREQNERDAIISKTIKRLKKPTQIITPFKAYSVRSHCSLL